MNNEAELVTTIGSFYQTDDQLSLGGHTERFAYYASVNGNRSNLGLETPIAQVYHDAENGFGGFTSLMYNLDSERSAPFRRAIAPGLLPDSLRSRSRTSFENSQWPTSGLRDHETGNRWVRALFLGPHVQPECRAHRFSLLPLQHLRLSQPAHRHARRHHATFSTNYGGGQAVLDFHAPKNDAQVGVYSFAASQNENFGLIFNDGSGNSLHLMRRIQSPATTSPSSPAINSASLPGSR